MFPIRVLVVLFAICVVAIGVMLIRAIILSSKARRIAAAIHDVETEEVEISLEEKLRMAKAELEARKTRISPEGFEHTVKEEK
jgi:hypothetical protein